MNRLFYVCKLPWGEKKKPKTQPQNPVELSSKSQPKPESQPMWVYNLAKNFCPATVLLPWQKLRGQRMQFVLSVLPDILCTLRTTDNKKLRFNSPWNVHCYVAGQILDSTTIPLFHLTTSREKILFASCHCTKSSTSARTCSPAWFKGHLDGRAKSQIEIVTILSSVGI